MVAGVGAAAYEAVLVQIADLGVDAFGERRGDGHGVAHPVLAGARLEGGAVEVEEAFVAADDGRGPAVPQLQAVFDVRAEPPPGAGDPVAPPLLHPQP